MYKRDFGGVIWTNHALDRLEERNISQGDAWAAFNRPDQSRRGTKPGSWVYYRVFDTKRMEVVAKKNEQGEWLILSVWERPLLRNEFANTKKQHWILRALRRVLFGEY